MLITAVVNSLLGGGNYNSSGLRYRRAATTLLGAAGNRRRVGETPMHGVALCSRDGGCGSTARPGERGVDLGELAGEQRQGGRELLLQQRFGDARKAVGLLALEPEQLAPAGAQRGQAQLLGWRRRGRLRAGELAVAGQRPGVDAIGFGEPAEAGGEGAQAAWNDPL